MLYYIILLCLCIQVKVCYLVAVLRQFIDQHREDTSDDDDDGIHGSDSSSSSNSRKRSRSGNTNSNSITTSNSIVQELCDELMNKNSNNKGSNKSYGRLKRLNKHNNSKHNNNKYNTNYNNKYYNERVKLTSSVMIFVGSCRRCAELTSTLQRLGQ